MAKLKYTAKKRRDREMNKSPEKMSATASKGAASSPVKRLASSRSVFRSKTALRQSPRGKMATKKTLSLAKVLRSPGRSQPKMKSSKESAVSTTRSKRTAVERSKSMSVSDGTAHMFDLSEDSEEHDDEKGEHEKGSKSQSPRGTAYYRQCQSTRNLRESSDDSNEDEADIDGDSDGGAQCERKRRKSRNLTGDFDREKDNVVGSLNRVGSEAPCKQRGRNRKKFLQTEDYGDGQDGTSSNNDDATIMSNEKKWRKMRKAQGTVEPQVPPAKTESCLPAQSVKVSQYFSAQNDNPDAIASGKGKDTYRLELKTHQIKDDRINRDAQVVLTKLPDEVSPLRGYKLGAVYVDNDKKSGSGTLEMDVVKGKTHDSLSGQKDNVDAKDKSRSQNEIRKVSGGTPGGNHQGSHARKVVKKAKLSLNRKVKHKAAKDLEKSLNETDDFTQAMPKFKVQSGTRYPRRASPKKVDSLSPKKGVTQKRNEAVSVSHLESYKYSKSAVSVEKLRPRSPQKGNTCSSSSKPSNSHCPSGDDPPLSAVKPKKSDCGTETSEGKQADGSASLTSDVLDEMKKDRLDKSGTAAQSGTLSHSAVSGKSSLVRPQKEESEGKKHEDKEANVALLCQICQKDLSCYSSQRRNEHVNRCIDVREEDETKRQDEQAAVEAARNKVLNCPLCGQTLKTHNARKAHLKKCASKYQIPTPTLMERIRQQEQEYQLQLVAGVLPITEKRGRGRPRKQKRVPTGANAVSGPTDYIGLDEQTQLALALSTSLQEEKQRKDLEQHIPSHILQGDPNVTDAFNVLMSPSKAVVPPAGKRGRKKKQGPQPELLTRTAAEVQERIARRVGTVIMAQDTEGQICPTPPMKKSEVKKKYASVEENQDSVSTLLDTQEDKKEGSSLWDKSALTGIPSEDHAAQFYVCELMPPVSPCKVKAGSKLKHLSQIPGRRKSTAPVALPQETGTKCSEPKTQGGATADSNLVASTQTAMVLAELAAHGEENDADLSHETTRPQPVLVDRCTQTLVDSGTQTTDSDSGEPKGFYHHEKNNNIEKEPSEESKVRLISDLQSLLNNAQYSDVTIQSKDDTIHYAHKSILLARCPKMLQKLEGGLVRLRRTPAAAVMCVLKFIYTAAIDIPDTGAGEALALATELELKDLIRAFPNHLSPIPCLETHSQYADKDLDDLLKDLWSSDSEHDESFAKEAKKSRNEWEEREMEELYEYMASQRERTRIGKGSNSDITSDDVEDNDELESDAKELSDEAPLVKSATQSKSQRKKIAKVQGSKKRKVLDVFGTSESSSDEAMGDSQLRTKSWKKKMVDKQSLKMRRRKMELVRSVLKAKAPTRKFAAIQYIRDKMRRRTSQGSSEKRRSDSGSESSQKKVLEQDSRKTRENSGGGSEDDLSESTSQQGKIMARSDRPSCDIHRIIAKVSKEEGNASLILQQSGYLNQRNPAREGLPIANKGIWEVLQDDRALGEVSSPERSNPLNLERSVERLRKLSKAVLKNKKADSGGRPSSVGSKPSGYSSDSSVLTRSETTDSIDSEMLSEPTVSPVTIKHEKDNVINGVENTECHAMVKQEVDGCTAGGNLKSKTDAKSSTDLCLHGISQNRGTLTLRESVVKNEETCGKNSEGGTTWTVYLKDITHSSSTDREHCSRKSGQKRMDDHLDSHKKGAVIYDGIKGVACQDDHLFDSNPQTNSLSQSKGTVLQGVHTDIRIEQAPTPLKTMENLDESSFLIPQTPYPQKMKQMSSASEMKAGNEICTYSRSQDFCTEHAQSEVTFTPSIKTERQPQENVATPNSFHEIHTLTSSTPVPCGSSGPANPVDSLDLAEHEETGTGVGYLTITDVRSIRAEDGQPANCSNGTRHQEINRTPEGGEQLGHNQRAHELSSSQLFSSSDEADDQVDAGPWSQGPSQESESNVCHGSQELLSASPKQSDCAYTSPLQNKEISLHLTPSPTGASQNQELLSHSPEQPDNAYASPVQEKEVSLHLTPSPSTSQGQLNVSTTSTPSPVFGLSQRSRSAEKGPENCVVSLTDSFNMIQEKQQGNGSPGVSCSQHRDTGQTGSSLIESSPVIADTSKRKRRRTQYTPCPASKKLRVHRENYPSPPCVSPRDSQSDLDTSVYGLKSRNYEDAPASSPVFEKDGQRTVLQSVTSPNAMAATPDQSGMASPQSAGSAPCGESPVFVNRRSKHRNTHEDGSSGRNSDSQAESEIIDLTQEDNRDVEELPAGSQCGIIQERSRGSPGNDELCEESAWTRSDDLRDGCSEGPSRDRPSSQHRLQQGTYTPASPENDVSQLLTTPPGMTSGVQGAADVWEDFDDGGFVDDVPFGSTSSQTGNDVTNQPQQSHTALPQAETNSDGEDCLVTSYDPPTDMDTTCEYSRLANDSFLWKDENEPEAVDHLQGTKHQTHPVPKVAGPKKTWVAPSPFTPMPKYSEMVTPELKQRCKSYGVRALPKKKMVTMLTEIYQGTHQYETDPEYEESFRAEQAGPSGRPGPDPVVDEVALLSSDEELDNKQQMDSPQKAASTTSESDPEPLLEETYIEPAESVEIDIPATQSKRPKKEENKEKIAKLVGDFIQSNKSLHLQVLQYEPLEFDTFHMQLKGAGIHIGADRLQEFLDEKSIQFTMRQKGPHVKPQKKRKAKKQKPADTATC